MTSLLTHYDITSDTFIFSIRLVIYYICYLLDLLKQNKSGFNFHSRNVSRVLSNFRYRQLEIQSLNFLGQLQHEEINHHVWKNLILLFDTTVMSNISLNYRKQKTAWIKQSTFLKFKTLVCSCHLLCSCET